MNPDSKYRLPYRAFVQRDSGPARGILKPSKLTTAQRLELSYRRHEGERVMDLALEYGVSTRTIYACSAPQPRP